MSAHAATRLKTERTAIAPPIVRFLAEMAELLHRAGIIGYQTGISGASTETRYHFSGGFVCFRSFSASRKASSSGRMSSKIDSMASIEADTRSQSTRWTGNPPFRALLTALKSARDRLMIVSATLTCSSANRPPPSKRPPPDTKRKADKKDHKHRQNDQDHD